MATTKLTNTFAIFFSNIPNINKQRKLVRMKQFLDKGLGENVEVINSMVIPVKFTYSGIIIVKADSFETIENAISIARNEFTIEIQKIETHVTLNLKEDTFSHCLFFSKTSGNHTPNYEQLNASNNSTKIHSEIHFADDLDINSILLVQTEDYFDAITCFEALHPDGKPIIRWVESFSEFLSKSENPLTMETPSSEVILPSPEETTLGQIHNEGNDTAYYASADSNSTDLRALLSNRKEALTGGLNPVKTNVHFWETLGGNFDYVLSWYTASNHSPLPTYHYQNERIETNAPIPSYIKQVGSGGLLSFNLPSKDTFHFDTELGTWLNDLFNTTKYDAPWPEDLYTGDDLDAYNNILSQLREKGYNSRPNQGFMAPSIISDNVKFPSDGSINKEAFDKVIEHLLNECTYFTNYTDKWFGGNGLFHSLILVTNAVAQSDLTSVANLMEIPQEKSKLMLILDAVIGDIIYFISAIPGDVGNVNVGNVIAAVINLAWSTAKLALAPGVAQNPIQFSIATMANEINKYLGLQLEANSKHLGIVNGNWGKLKEFSIGAINGKKINPAMFGMESSDNRPTPPEAYFSAVTNAWRAICYKGLFPGHYDVKATLNIVSTAPKPRFNRITANHVYSYYLNCEYLNSSENQVAGFIELVYKNSAPKQVLDDLFRPENLNLNPIEFYLGYNGWKRVLPIYYDEDVHALGVIPETPIKKVTF